LRGVPHVDSPDKGRPWRAGAPASGIARTHHDRRYPAARDNSERVSNDCVPTDEPRMVRVGHVVNEEASRLIEVIDTIAVDLNEIDWLIGESGYGCRRPVGKRCAGPRRRASQRDDQH
jgi:hypothetical protein